MTFYSIGCKSYVYGYMFTNTVHYIHIHEAVSKVFLNADNTDDADLHGFLYC